MLNGFDDGKVFSCFINSSIFLLAWCLGCFFLFFVDVYSGLKSFKKSTQNFSNMNFVANSLWMLDVTLRAHPRLFCDLFLSICAR